MANTLRKVCMVLGLLLIAAALCLFVYNHREAELAAQTAEQALQEISGTSYALEQPKESDTHPIIPYYISEPTTSDSRKRSTHKHIYKKIILHYGSDSFAWGRQCEICGRVDSTYKSSYWNPKEFQVTGEGLYGEWRNICLTEIHRKYPESVVYLRQSGSLSW